MGRLQPKKSRPFRQQSACTSRPTKHQGSTLNRRQWLGSAGGGMSSLALAYLLSSDGVFADTPRADLNGGLHHTAKAKRVIQLFMNGGVSQVDTFDYKPELEKRHGEQVDMGIQATATGTPGAMMKSPFPWKRHGESGRWVTNVFPEMAKHVDDMAFLMAMRSKTSVHGPASYMQNTGFVMPGFPCLGSWLSYGLGSLTDELPAFVVLPDPRGLPYNATGNFLPGFLPAAHQGMIVDTGKPNPIENLHPSAEFEQVTTASEADGLSLLKALNQEHLATRPHDSRLSARIDSYELAAKLQLSAPEALELKNETQATLDAYGLGDDATAGFGRNCLIARRLIERDVRFVQVWSGMDGAANNWDNHGNIPNELPPIARSVDRPIGALLTDLKQRGLLEDTLVIFTTEFGRMPMSQNSVGRDHNSETFVTWLAGAGVKSGVAHGESDDFGYQGVSGVTYCYDLHATVLHLLGIDHKRLTYRHNGIDRRLTDVHGHVIGEILT
jgi:hypothetical protein